MNEAWHRTNIWSVRIHMAIEIMAVDGIVCEKVWGEKRRGPPEYHANI